MSESYSLIQDGCTVATADGPNAFAEICHYAMIYGQDATVQIIDNSKPSEQTK